MSKGSNWRSAATGVHWFSKPRPDGSTPDGDPFAGGVLNLCFNAVDRHVALGRADQLALRAPALPGLGEQPGGHAVVELTYARLLERVAIFAGVLRALGAVAPDRVLIALPSGADAVIALLGCWRLGCSATLLNPADGPPTAELIAAEQPLVAVTTSSGRAGLQTALDGAAHGPARTLVVREPGAPAVAEADLDLALILRSTAIQPTECVALDAGTPAGPDGQGGAGGPTLGELTVALRWAAAHVLGLRPGEMHTPPAGSEPVSEPAACILAPLLIGATLDWTQVGAPEAPRAAGVSSSARAADLHWVPPVDWPHTGGLLDRPGRRWVSPPN